MQNCMTTMPFNQYITELKRDKRYDTELWRFSYECHSYLSDTSDALLDHRHKILTRNIAHLVNDLRHNIPRELPFLSSWWWLSLYEHMHFEYEKRKRAFPPCDLSIPLPQIWPKGFRPKGPNSNDHIVRYSQLRFLKQTIMEGHLIFRPASEYLSEYMDEARRDNELEMNSFSPGRYTTLKTQEGHIMPIIGELKRTRATTTDYNLLCFANEFDQRLFTEFGANACIVIWNIAEFTHRVSTVLRISRLAFDLFPLQVMYFDPRNVLPRQLVVPGSCKDIEFAYQREYRFILHPKDILKKSAKIDLRIGSIEDIAGLYSIDGIFLGIGSELPA